VVDRAVRNLSFLQKSASTARVLNLHNLWRRVGDTPEWRTKPLFHHPALNRGIFIKHRVRQNEHELFDDGRPVATKILLPLDPNDLRAGGRYVFVGELGFDQVMENVFGQRLGADQRDRRLLELLDQIPSLDPFLLREHLRRHGFEAAACYFELSEGDAKRIFSFVEEEVQPLVRLSLQGGLGFAGETAKLVRKMLASTIDGDLDPLRLTLRLEPDQFAEGVFCWKGFLYYKWALKQTAARIPAVARQIAQVQPRGTQPPHLREYIEATRSGILASLALAMDGASRILDVYDRAFGGLIDAGDPLAFRDFLLAAPERFVELGDRLGAVTHLVSFWSFRFPEGVRSFVTADELADIFQDFEQGLVFPNRSLAFAGW
jgi:hypothetical protein